MRMRSMASPDCGTRSKCNVPFIISQAAKVVPLADHASAIACGTIIRTTVKK